MYKKETLPNGLRVVTHDMKARDSVSIGFWIGVGGRYETDDIKGAAHFLEHIVFKGSEKYSCKDIKEKVEGVGGALNAFTSEEQTCYYAKTPSKHLDQTFDVLADMVLFPKIRSTDVKKESTVILEEIKMYHDLSQYYVIELLDGLVWPDQPLGKFLAGTQETVSSMTSKQLKAFHKKSYSQKNICLSVCGHVNHKHVVDLASKKLGHLNGSMRNEFEPCINDQQEPRVHLHKRDIEQMHMALGFLGYDENHSDRFGLSLLSIILGGNMSSRLFVEVRENRGLAYSISSSTRYMHDTGLFVIRAGLDNQKIVGALELILKELKKIGRNGVTESEFRRAKDYLMGQLMIGLEDTMEHMLWLGESVISKDKVKTVKQVISDIENVKKADIKRIAKSILSHKRTNLAVVGPITEDQDKKLKDIIYQDI